MGNYIETKVKVRLAALAGEFRLNKKEEEFLRFCAMDIPYREIAERMGKSPRTIDGYRDMLFRQLEVRSRTGLVLWCFKSGFLKVKDIRLEPHRSQQKKRPTKNSRASHMRKNIKPKG